jgi:hypothetical protein
MNAQAISTNICRKVSRRMTLIKPRMHMIAEKISKFLFQTEKADRLQCLQRSAA